LIHIPIRLSCHSYSACGVYFDLLWRKTKTEEMARPERLELPTFWFVARRSDPTELRARGLQILT
jgi:hypothetical protein